MKGTYHSVIVGIPILLIECKHLCLSSSHNSSPRTYCFKIRSSRTSRYYSPPSLKWSVTLLDPLLNLGLNWYLGPWLKWGLNL